MLPARKPVSRPPEYAYHLLRGALECFSKIPTQLSDSQLQEAVRRADQTFATESLVLTAPEARDVVIPESRLDQAVAEVASRYAGREAFLNDLDQNSLSESTLRRALRRELVFDAVMNRIGARRPEISDLDVQIFYELHQDRYVRPERRVARHLLVTVNPAFSENTPEVARDRIERWASRVRRDPRCFAALAQQHSECPSALEGGLLGAVERGTLYPELDRALFRLRAGEVSDVVETEMGYHIVRCEKIETAQSIPLTEVRQQIRQVLDRRSRRVCQKAWLKTLRGPTHDR
ncbi:MAG: nitrogen fixation protein NifM [Pseudomonadota bacterium]|nr:nitrogen fixation protein NifM [Pseudomonadota bacterium]